VDAVNTELVPKNSSKKHASDYAGPYPAYLETEQAELPNSPVTSAKKATKPLYKKQLTTYMQATYFNAYPANASVLT